MRPDDIITFASREEFDLSIHQVKNGFIVSCQGEDYVFSSAEQLRTEIVKLLEKLK